MKTTLSIVLSSVFAASLSTAAFAQCSHNYEAADLSQSKVAAAEVKTEEAMSTFDPVKVEVLLDVKKAIEEVKTSE